MKTRFFRPSFAGIAMLVATCGFAAAQTAPQNTQSMQDSSQTAQSTENLQLVSANAQLTKAVSTKNASDGQMVMAKLTSNVKTADGMKLDKGTMLIGKVEQARKSTDGSPAKLSIVFDQARLSNGRTVPVKATLLGAYPANAGDYWVDTSASGSLMPIQAKHIPDDQKIDQEPGALSHVAMRSAVQSNVSGVFTSRDRNVSLKRGTRLQIAIAPGVAS